MRVDCRVKKATRRTQMKQTFAGSIAAAIWLGVCAGPSVSLATQALAADAGAANPPAGANNVSAANPAPGADVPAWRRQQIASARPLTGKDAPMRFEELLGTEVRNPRDELLGSVVDLVRSPRTDKIVYLVIAPDKKLESTIKTSRCPWKTSRSHRTPPCSCSRPARAPWTPHRGRTHFRATALGCKAARWMPTGRPTSRIETTEEL